MISIIIPAYNAQDFLAEAVHSLLNTSVQDLEILIINDNSKDKTAEIAEELSRQNPGCIRVLHRPQHVKHGAAATRNAGIKLASHNLISFLDADDVVYPERFNTALNKLKDNPEIDVIYDNVKMVYYDDRERINWQNKPIFGLSSELTGHQLLETLLYGKEMLPTHGLTIRASILKRTGLFDETLETAEDCHLWWRLAVAGKIVPGNLSQPVAEYRRRAGTLFRRDSIARLNYIKALHSFGKWLVQHPEYKDNIPTYDAVLKSYLDNSLITARHQHDRSMLFTILIEMLRKSPTSLLTKRSVAHAVYGLLGY